MNKTFKGLIFYIELRLKKNKKPNLFDDDNDKDDEQEDKTLKKVNQSQKDSNQLFDEGEKEENDKKEAEAEVKQEPNPPKSLDFATELAMKLKAKSSLFSLESKTQLSENMPSQKDVNEDTIKKSLSNIRPISLFDEPDDDDSKEDLFSNTNLTSPKQPPMIKVTQSSAKSKSLFDDSMQDLGEVSESDLSKINKSISFQESKKEPTQKPHKVDLFGMYQ